MTRPDYPRDWDAIEADALAAEDAREERADEARRDRIAARILTAVDLGAGSSPGPRPPFTPPNGDAA